MDQDIRAGEVQNAQHKYVKVPTSEAVEDECEPRKKDSRASTIPGSDEHPLEALEHHLKRFKRGHRTRLIIMVMAAFGMFLVLYWASV